MLWERTAINDLPKKIKLLQFPAEYNCFTAATDTTRCTDFLNHLFIHSVIQNPAAWIFHHLLCQGMESPLRSRWDSSCQRSHSLLAGAGLWLLRESKASWASTSPEAGAGQRPVLLERALTNVSEKRWHWNSIFWDFSKITRKSFVSGDSSVNPSPKCVTRCSEEEYNRTWPHQENCVRPPKDSQSCRRWRWWKCLQALFRTLQRDKDNHLMAEPGWRWTDNLSVSTALPPEGIRNTTISLSQLPFLKQKDWW